MNNDINPLESPEVGTRGLGDLLGSLGIKENYTEIEPPEGKQYWLSAHEYNLLIDSLKVWLDDYNKRIGEITHPTGYQILTTTSKDPATDVNIFSSLRTLMEIESFREELSNFFLSRINDDTAEGNLTFKGDTNFGNYEEDNNSGGIISPNGDSELNSLKLREWLEVPELRFNRVEVMMGEKWRSPGGGIIDKVEILSDTSGIITLKLEEGEYGAVSINDICTGVFHSIESENNSNSDSDNSKGSRNFKGFATTYFRVTRILEADNSKFEYVLRPLSSTHTRQIHPEKFSHFAAYGNTTNVRRQDSSYESRTYQRYLTGVNSWEYGFSNIASQYGDLSNMDVHGYPNMEGYSAYLNNVYFSGKLIKVHAPRIINGYWYEYNPDCGDPSNTSCWDNTGVKAEGADANSPYVGSNGNWWVWDEDSQEYVDSGDPSRGDDGKSPEIRNGTWWVWDNEKQEWVNTGISATGPPGKDSPQFIYLGAFEIPPQPIRNPQGGEPSFKDEQGIYHKADSGCYYRSTAFETSRNLYIWKYDAWVFWMKDGEDGISPINVSITNETVTIDRNNPSYAGTGTELAVWEGEEQLTYSTAEYNKGSRGFYIVDRAFTNITGGPISASNGNMIAGNASNMTKGAAKIVYDIKGYRLDGKQFTFSKTQVFQQSGLDGVNSFKSTIFKRSVTTPATPRGGTYNSPLPNPLEGWEDGIPAGKDPLHASTRIFSNTGAFPQQDAWTKPGLVADTNEIQFRFSTVKNNPGNPTSNANNWTSNSTPQAWWMAVRYLELGVWSSWQVSKIRGEDGRDGSDTEFIYKYSEIKPARPVGDSHGWSFTPDIVLNNVTEVKILTESHPSNYKWLKYGTSYKSPTLGHNQETKLRLEITTSSVADVMMTIKASSATGDFLYISELNAASITDTSYKDRVDGVSLKNVIFKNVSKGKHTVWIMYKKNASVTANHDSGYIEPMGFQDIIWMSTRRYKDEIWTAWSDPVRYINDASTRETIYSKAIDVEPVIEKSEDIDEYLPNPCRPGKFRTVFIKTASYDFGDCFKHNGNFYTCISPYNGTSNTVDDPATIPSVFKYTYPWTDNITGVDSVAQYEYLSTRDRAADGTWGEFTAPRLNAHFGQDGEEADNYPIVFRGAWQSNTPYHGSLARVEVVSVGTGDNLYYYTTKASVNGNFTTNINPKEDSLRWKAFPHSYVALASSLIVAEKANIGEFVIHNGKMVSQMGHLPGSNTPIDIANNTDPNWEPFIRLDGKDGTKSIINAGRVGGFNIANQVLTSQDKTNGIANLTLDGKTGHIEALNAKIRGTFESNASGNRITISAEDRSFLMLNAASEKILSISHQNPDNHGVRPTITLNEYRNQTAVGKTTLDSSSLYIQAWEYGVQGAIVSPYVINVYTPEQSVEISSDMIFLNKSTIAGLGLNTKVLAGSGSDTTRYWIAEEDSIVIFDGNINRTIELPTSPPVGRYIMLTKRYNSKSATITVRPTGLNSNGSEHKMIIATGPASTITIGGRISVLFDGSNWQVIE